MSNFNLKLKKTKHFVISCFQLFETLEKAKNEQKICAVLHFN